MNSIIEAQLDQKEQEEIAETKIARMFIELFEIIDRKEYPPVDKKIPDNLNVTYKTMKNWCDSLAGINGK